MESETKGRKVRALNKTYKNIKWTMTVIDEGKGRGLKGRRIGSKVQHFLDSYTIVCRACGKKIKRVGETGVSRREQSFSRSLNHLKPAPLPIPAVARILQPSLLHEVEIRIQALERLSVHDILQDRRVLLVGEPHPRERVDLSALIVARWRGRICRRHRQRLVELAVGQRWDPH